MLTLFSMASTSLFSTYATAEWPEDDSMDVVDDSDAESDDHMFDSDQDAIEEEMQDEFERGVDDDKYWLSFFTFVILHKDETGRALISPLGLGDERFGVIDVRGDFETTPCTSLFASHIRHYLTYHPFEGMGPRDFVYYLNGKRYDPRDPEHDQPLTKPVYSNELLKRTKNVYTKRQLEDVLSDQNTHNYLAVVVHRDSTLVPDDVRFDKVHLMDDETMANVTCDTKLIDLHEKEKKDERTWPRLWNRDFFLKIDLPLLFLGWEYGEGGEVRVKLDHMNR